MTYNVVLTDTAKQDIRDIAVWIAEQSHDMDTATNFVSGLYEKCKNLSSFPNRGALPNDHILKSLGYRFITHKNYLIFYTVDDTNKEVCIMAIFNAKRDYARVMRKYITDNK